MKKLKVEPIDRNSDRTKKLRVEYAEWYWPNLSKKWMVFTDECPFNLWVSRSMGRAPIGKQAIAGNYLPKGNNQSLFMAINTDMGVVGFDIKEKTSGSHGSQQEISGLET